MKLRSLILFFLISSMTLSQELRFSAMIDDLDLPVACKESLKSVYSAGVDLSSEILKKSIINIKDYNSVIDETRSPINGLDFYHYTDFDFTSVFNSEELGDGNYLLKDKEGYKEIFGYLKKRRMKTCCSSSTKNALFIAEDTKSSAHFGKSRLKIILDENTKVLIADKRGNLLSGDNWQDIFNEVNAKYLDLSETCNMRHIRSIIIEDSGADLIAYKNWGVGPTYRKAWFILLNSKVINYSEFFKPTL